MRLTLLCFIFLNAYHSSLYANTFSKKKVGIFVNLGSFEGKDLQQKKEYNTLIQRLLLQTPAYHYKRYPLKNIKNDARILTKAAIDKVESLIILKKASPRYISVSLWDVQNYELLQETAFEDMGSRKLIDDFSDWVKAIDSTQLRRENLDQELFAKQLVKRKYCSLLKIYLKNIELDSLIEDTLTENCTLKQNFKKMLSGKKVETRKKQSTTGPADIKISSNHFSSAQLIAWKELIENSHFVSTLGRYDISSVAFKFECVKDCNSQQLNISIMADDHLDFRTQYRFSTHILKLVDQSKQSKLTSQPLILPCIVGFYNGYIPIQTLKISGSTDVPNIEPYKP